MRKIAEVLVTKQNITISKPEMVVRLVEVLTGADRPPGHSAEQLMQELKHDAPEVLKIACDLADAAMGYILEEMAGETVQ